ncbi:hypothetical protein LXM94_00190 [Rhizobium sp. TRM95111]|uniref:hypothetical protein n=1 Tax=Rhizobium alarense TaxID=2846851 RepID=UPI001F2C948E|nr:hypothetical protein [Rhizobium alarense]MCF3638388.1 hypothetical protein [Rhizobium alarense]
MKGSLATSAVLHAVVLTMALVSLGSPESFDVADVEAMPVDIVPIEEFTQIQQGDKKATLKEKSNPIPTTRPTEVENAENTGDNEIDLKTPPTPEDKPQNVETAAAPEKSETALPTPEPVEEEAEEVKQEEPASEPATEVAALPEAKQEVEPDPVPDQEPAEQAPAENADAEALPEKVPVPVARPKTAEAQTAKTPERKNEEKREQRKSASAKESDFNADEVAALLNKTESKGGGAKRSTEEASLGGKKTTTGSKLSMSEMDALRGQIQNNWSIIPGMADAQDVRIKVSMRLDQNGDIIGEPEVVATGGSEAARRALAGGARRAIMKSRPFRGLPPEKYDAWSEVIVNFDPSEMM